MLLEILILVFGIFAISRSFIRLRSGHESIFEFIMWSLVWIMAIVIVLYPELTSIPAKIFNIQRGIDVFVYFGIVVLFYMVYRIYSKIESVEEDITILSRSIAQKHSPKNKKTSKKKK